MSTNDSTQDFENLTIQLRDQYRVVDKIIADVFARQSSVATTKELEHINDELNQVQSIESRLKPMRDALQDSGQSVPGNLKPAIDETIQIVMSLIPRIAELEQAAISSRDKLAPLIHESVRAIDMQNAYQSR